MKKFKSYYQKTVAYEALNGKEVNLTGDYAIYDMATAFLGPNWRMPTKAEYDALCESNSWGDNNSLNARTVVFPAARRWYNGSHSGSGLGIYWSSSCGNGERAYSLHFNRSNETVNRNNYVRSYGLSVRPVQK